MGTSARLAPCLRMSLQGLSFTEVSGCDTAGQAMRGSYSGKSLVESARAR
jgi:hypothetical protein